MSNSARKKTKRKQIEKRKTLGGTGDGCVASRSRGGIQKEGETEKCHGQRREKTTTKGNDLGKGTPFVQGERSPPKAGFGKHEAGFFQTAYQ